jgi:hypothetical protein
LSDEAGIADMAIFPFVRQFAAVDDIGGKRSLTQNCMLGLMSG